MRELRPLRLPQMLEARRKEDVNMSPEFRQSQSTSSSDLQSPLTPTFSLRAHARFPSSTSSLASSPVMRESMDGFGSGKRPLTEVREDPQERDDDYEMVGSPESLYRENDDLERSMSYSEASVVAEARMRSPSPDYDLTDGTLCDSEAAMDPRPKRQRAGDFPSNGFTSRLGTKFPSLSQKWRNKRAGKAASIVDSIQDVRPSRSRANSTRASSFIGSEGPEKEHQSPPTPARSIHDEASDDAQTSVISISKAPTHDDEVEYEMKASTPLLPPIMANIAPYLEEVPFQSPLQSPTIADQDCPSIAHTPIAQTPITHNPITTPQFSGLPSPPLSTRPSISSFHRHPLLPSAEIPPLPLTTPNDPWTDKLGHANFTTAPEPYVPSSPSFAAYKQLRADWDLARCNYTKHLLRTTEHYGATSKIHRLTEEKWAEIDAAWKRNSEACIAAATLADNSNEKALELSQTSVAEPAPLIKIPSLNGPRSEGKFPKLGDEVIVGPMEQIAAQIQAPRRTSKKRTFLKFLQGMLPSGAGMFGRERSPSG